MSPFVAVRTCLEKYADFDGRAAPWEFWWFAIGVLVVCLAARGVDAALGTDWRGYGLLSSLLLLALLLPLLAAGARRLHDGGATGLWLLLLLVPCGAIALFFMLIRASRGDNAYGPALGT